MVPMSDLLGPSNQPAHVAPPPLAWTPHPERGDDLRGELLAGRFRVRERIGRGGMAWVYLCDDLVLRAPVALKLLKSREPLVSGRAISVLSGHDRSGVSPPGSGAGSAARGAAGGSPSS